VAAYIAAVAYGSARVSSSFFVETICAGPVTNPVIALTFDDGPVATTPRVLEILRQHDVKATFFCIGSRVAASPEVAKQIDAAGHLIGNHTYSHSYVLDLYSAGRLTHELQDTDAAVMAAIGKRPRLFRPTYGVTTPNLARAIRRVGHLCIGWSVRSMDTVVKEESTLLSNMVRALNPGAVFLFHDSSLATVGILDEFIQEANQRGYAIIPLDQLLGIYPYA
jgi:peptidoglycan/xylan/chitin deacetylase (PgdA/CDA1 family)